MTLIIINGEIDLSVASVMGLAACVMAWLFQLGVPLPLALVAALAAGRGRRAVQRLLDRLCRPAVARRDPRRPDRLSRHRPHPGRGPGDRRLSGLVQHARPAAADRAADRSRSSFSSFVSALIAIILHAPRFGRLVYVIGNNLQARPLFGRPREAVKIAPVRRLRRDRGARRPPLRGAPRLGARRHGARASSSISSPSCSSAA